MGVSAGAGSGAAGPAGALAAVVVVVVPASGGAASVVGMVSARGAASAASAAVVLEAAGAAGSPSPDVPPPQPATSNASRAAAASPPRSAGRQRRERARWGRSVDSGRSDWRPGAGLGTKPKLEHAGNSGHRPVAAASSETSVKWVTVAGTTPNARVAPSVSASAERSENGTPMRPAAAISSVGFSNHMRAAILP